MRALVLGALAACAVVASAGAAVAQEYGESTGPLAVAGAAIPGNTLQVSGSGFAPNSVVYLELTAGATGVVGNLGTLPTDASGIFSGSATLPSELTLGPYTLSATGVTEDGTTRVLSAEVEVMTPEEEVEDGGLSAAAWWAIIGAAAALAALGGGWWLFVARRRR